MWSILKWKPHFGIEREEKSQAQETSASFLWICRSVQPSTEHLLVQSGP